MKTKKVGSTGRFGPRYGRRAKLRVREIEKLKRGKKCPQCKAPSLKRIAFGIWTCKKCGVKFAGGAYTPVVKGEAKVQKAEETKEVKKEEKKEK